MILLIPEIIYTISKFLDSSTKSSCVVVCKTWNRNVFWTSKEILQKLQYCCLKGQTEMFTRLLGHHRLNLTSKSLTSVLNTASAHGHVDIVNILLDSRVTSPMLGKLPLRLACRYGQFDVVKRLLRDHRIDPSESLDEAVAKGCYEIVECLLSDQRVKLTANIIMNAVKRGTVPVLDRILTVRSNTQFRYNYRKALKVAVRRGRLGILNRLLTDNVDTDPTRSYKAAFIVSIRYGKLPIMLRLLEYGVNGTIALRNRAIREASTFGHDILLRYLLNDRDVDPANRENYSFFTALEKGHTHIIHTLLQDTRIDISGLFNF